MKANLTYEKVKINKLIFNKNLEHSIDFSYQLPDYYTGIFKVLEFDLEPHISSCRTLNSQLIVDGNAKVKLLYIDEEEGDIKALHQNIPFSKTVELDEDISNAILFYNVKTTYKNCKIISPKKIDIKANLSIPVKVQLQKEENVLKSAAEKDLQLKLSPIKITSDQIWSTQQFDINEQIELSEICKEILDVKVKIADDEFKVIQNKIIAKSVAHIEILYCGETKNTPILEKSSVSINNIIDLPKINENFLYNVKYDVNSVTFEISQDGKILNVKADVLIDSFASLSEQINVVTDAFSTKFDIDFKEKQFNSTSYISTINEEITTEETLKNINISKLFNIDVNITEVNHMQKKSKVDFRAKLNLNILAANKDGTLESLFKSIPIEFEIKNNNVVYDYTKININNLTILKTDFELKDSGTIKLKVKFNIKGFVFTSGDLKTLKNITIDETKIKEPSKAALTLYYPKSGEKIWDIAKSFKTSPLAIAEANNIEDETINDESMLIIPII